MLGAGCGVKHFLHCQQCKCRYFFLQQEQRLFFNKKYEWPKKRIIKSVPREFDPRHGHAWCGSRVSRGGARLVLCRGGHPCEKVAAPARRGEQLPVDLRATFASGKREFVFTEAKSPQPSRSEVCLGVWEWGSARWAPSSVLPPPSPIPHSPSLSRTWRRHVSQPQKRKRAPSASLSGVF